MDDNLKKSIDFKYSTW